MKPGTEVKIVSPKSIYRKRCGFVVSHHDARVLALPPPVQESWEVFVEFGITGTPIGFYKDEVEAVDGTD